MRVGEHAGGADGEDGRDGPQDAEEEELVVSDIAVLVFDPRACVSELCCICGAGGRLDMKPRGLLRSPPTTAHHSPHESGQS